MAKLHKKFTDGEVRRLVERYIAGERIYPRRAPSMENIARYIIRASFS
ncbi:MAG: hypothetical protein IMZ59_05660 [Actinobacteria bacterium]|nr:hypothetical protein [Actinomycetota bacterium]